MKSTLCGCDFSSDGTVRWGVCALPLRFALRHGAIELWGAFAPWVSLTPEAFAPPTAMFLSPLRGSFQYGVYR